MESVMRHLQMGRAILPHPRRSRCDPGPQSPMCYPALIRADYAKLVREFGAILSLEEFAELYAHDPGKKRPKTPKAMDDGFAGARTEQGRDIVAKIQQWHAQEQQALEAELVRQRERRDIAHATLATR